MRVPVVPGLSRNDIEYAAVLLLQQIGQQEALQGKCPVDIEEIFEFYIPDSLGIKTGYTDLSRLGNNILGYTDASEKISLVDKTLIDADDNPTLRRCRATIAHESGHCLQHVAILNIFKSLSSRGDERLYRAERTEIPAYRDPEWQAWEFARACLMPRSLIMKYHSKGYSLEDMAECFDLNPAFIDVRLRTLKIKPF